MIVGANNITTFQSTETLVIHLRNCFNDSAEHNNMVYFFLQLSNEEKYSPYFQWIKMGSPQQPTKDQVNI